MDEEQAKKIQKGHELALELPLGQREEFIGVIAGDDAAMYAELKKEIGGEAPARRSMIPWNPGEKIGKYRLIQRIGKGGRGEVFEAVDEETIGETSDPKVSVALKRLQLSGDNEDRLARFVQERQRLADLKHPKIARLLDGGVTRLSIPYLVTEYVKGRLITEYCDEKTLNVKERLELFLQLCEAVQYIHNRPIVHRDLKPANILVTGEGVVKVLDFGIAKLLGEHHSLQPMLTSPAVRLGTQRYASPEQFKGKATGISSDIYSMGVILYEMLTGHSPYSPEMMKSRQWEKIICHEPPLDPALAVDLIEKEITDSQGRISDITPDRVSAMRQTSTKKLRQQMKGDLGRILLKTLNKQPEERYKSAQQLAEDIRKYLNWEPVEARRQSFPYRAVKWIRRNPRGASVIAVLLAIVSYGSYLSAISFAERDRQQKREVASHQMAIDLLGDASLHLYGDPDSTHCRPAIRQLWNDHLDCMQALANDLSQIDPLANIHSRRNTLFERLGETKIANPTKTNCQILKLNHDGAEK
jgi:serine/threonine protein kinase